MKVLLCCIPNQVQEVHSIPENLNILAMPQTKTSRTAESVDAVVVGIVMGVGMRAAGAEAIVRSRSSTRSRSSAAVAVA